MAGGMSGALTSSGTLPPAEHPEDDHFSIIDSTVCLPQEISSSPGSHGFNQPLFPPTSPLRLSTTYSPLLLGEILRDRIHFRVPHL